MSRTPVPATPAAPLEHDDYPFRRIIERVGMELDASMREKNLTIADVAKATSLTKEAVARIVDGTAKDIDLFMLVDVFYACGFRLVLNMVSASLVRERLA